MKIGSRNKVD